MIRLLGLTWRIEWRGMENYAAARGMSKQVIFAFWHGRLLVLSYTHRGRRIQVLASEHQDGDLMGRAITWLGFGHLIARTGRTLGYHYFVEEISNPSYHSIIFFYGWPQLPCIQVNNF